MFIIFIIVLVLIIIFGPQLWVKYTLKRYSDPIASLPGTGGELAKHLLNRLEINNVKVEEGKTDENLYDSHNKIVKLAPDVHNEKSLTAVTIAAHEVGHAIQDHVNYAPMRVREKLARVTFILEKIAAVLLISVPFISLLTRIPQLGIVTFLCGICILGLPILLHLITLPVEFDASFNRALPVLEQGNYLPDKAMPIANKILTAAALTYVSASLMSLLNFYRWIAILRR